jgi:hypothetical protein
MKTKGILLATLSILGFSGAFAQAVEYDDMYFNADDRAALKAQTAVELAYRAPEKTNKFDASESSESLNPTDSYSARNVNPEYTSRAQSQSAQAEGDDYFVTNYQYNRNQLTNWNNDYNNWYNNRWYRSGYYGAGINSWNSPYYGYNSYSSPWYDPSWSYNGWSSSFSYFYGPSWDYGWGGSYNYWNRPFYGWDSYYGGGWYGGGYWNNYMYPGTVIVINQNESNGRGVVYGKRPTRGTSLVSGRGGERSRTVINSSVRNDNSNGRTSSSGRQADYYNRYNRSQESGSYNYGSRSNTENNRSRSWGSWDSNNGSSNRSSSPSYTPSRSSSTMSTGSGARTNSGGSSTGGRRGRD